MVPLPSRFECGSVDRVEAGMSLDAPLTRRALLAGSMSMLSESKLSTSALEEAHADIGRLLADL